MSELITKEQVADAFQEASQCAAFRDCKKIAQAMCKFYRLERQQALETNQKHTTFVTEPEEPCPNRDQLFCNDLDFNQK